MKWQTQRRRGSTLLEDQGVGSGPNPGNLPNVVGIILPLISIWNYQLVKTNHATYCRPTLCLNLNKATFYLSLCLSLNSFCNETLRTWASLCPKTRYCGFGLGLSPSYVHSSPMQGFGWVWVPVTWVLVQSRVLAGSESQPHGFKSLSEVNGFNSSRALITAKWIRPVIQPARYSISQEQGLWPLWCDSLRVEFIIFNLFFKFFMIKLISSGL